MSQPVDLSVVIVSYNVRFFLEQALRSVQRAAERLTVEVFVVDNNSRDDSVALVRTRFPEVEVIANADNPGFSIANNQAIRRAHGRYVLLLNPDTVVEEDTFDKCVAFLDATPRAGALGVRMIDGSGRFLPESKRGFPSPWVAFCKTFGLSTLFPRSETFNRYHLGYLDEHATHEVDVLSGAFMLLRKQTLDEIGLLDEQFFMYGEDIDLSYRVVLGGYRNYYFPETTILHYKGESTKKGSLNYVRVFYQAMIKFARKHFEGERARVFIWLLQIAIYFRAALTLLHNLGRRFFFPLMDALLIFGGMVLLKQVWAAGYFDNPDYYRPTYLRVNVPLYIALWIGSVYFSGGYDEPYRLRRLGRGLLIGTLLCAAVYGFLPLEYRTSRALLLLGAVWALASTTALRTAIHFFRTGNLAIGRVPQPKLLIVGSAAEAARVQDLLLRARVAPNYVGRVAVTAGSPADSLGELADLDDIVHIYGARELIFCGKDVRAERILHWMSRLGPALAYRIVPADSGSIIGSASKNTAGELYTIALQFAIATPMARRNKRLVDVGVGLLVLLTFPLLFWTYHPPVNTLRNAWRVLRGQRTWVGYATADPDAQLPTLRPGVLAPPDALRRSPTDPATLARLDLLYAKDYRAVHDLDLLRRNWRALGK